MISVIFGIIRGNFMDLDICFVIILIEKLYVFFFVIWGLVFDVDIESERYRFLGEIRFFIGIVVRIIGLRKYRGRFLYLFVDDVNGGEDNLVYNFILKEDVSNSVVECDVIFFF